MYKTNCCIRTAGLECFATDVPDVTINGIFFAHLSRNTRHRLQNKMAQFFVPPCSIHTRTAVCRCFVDASLEKCSHVQNIQITESHTHSKTDKHTDTNIQTYIDTDEQTNRAVNQGVKSKHTHTYWPK